MPVLPRRKEGFYKMVPPAGLEPAPERAEIACPIQLGDGGIGAAWENRTPLNGMEARCLTTRPRPRRYIIVGRCRELRDYAMQASASETPAFD